MTGERFASIIIAAHLAAATLHGIAHGVLDVPAGGRTGLLIIAAAVFVGPLVALAGLLGRHRTTGAFVLSVSMGIALVYGLLFHYVLATPDRTVYARAGLAGEIFRASAAVIAALEASGFAVGVRLSLEAFGRRPSADGQARRGAPLRAGSERTGLGR